MAYEYADLRMMIVLMVTEDYALRIDPSGRPVYIQLWFGLRIFHDNPSRVQHITLSGPVPGEEYLWNLQHSSSVAIVGSRTFRHLTRSNHLHRVAIDFNPMLHLDQGVDFCLFQPCYVHVTGYNHVSSHSHGDTLYAHLYDDYIIALILRVDIGPSFTQNRQVFMERYMNMLNDVFDDDWSNLDNHT